MEKKFYVDEVKKLVEQYNNKQITIGKLTEILNDKKVADDSKCKKHHVVFDYVNGSAVCPVCK